MRGLAHWVLGPVAERPRNQICLYSDWSKSSYVEPTLEEVADSGPVLEFVLAEATRLWNQQHEGY